LLAGLLHGGVDREGDWSLPFDDVCEFSIGHVTILLIAWRAGRPSGLHTLAEPLGLFVWQRGSLLR
jgi:hypothetical protein